MDLQLNNCQNKGLVDGSFTICTHAHCVTAGCIDQTGFVYFTIRAKIWAQHLKVCYPLCVKSVIQSCSVCVCVCICIYIQSRILYIASNCNIVVFMTVCLYRYIYKLQLCINEHSTNLENGIHERRVLPVKFLFYIKVYIF